MIGTQLAHYRVTSKIGEGGMGEVWRATDTTLDREVALKVLPADFASDEDRRARFEREAKALASLNHPNIATVFGFEEIEDRTILVMELLEGESLCRRPSSGSSGVVSKSVRKSGTSRRGISPSSWIHWLEDPDRHRVCRNDPSRLAKAGMCRFL
jgi:serine/threonine protein kinase